MVLYRLTSLLTAFSLFPSWARFFKKGKLLAVSASFTASLLLLLLACCVYVRGDWFFTALTAILFAYAAVFLPILLALYPVPRAIKKNNPIISVGVDFLLLLTLIFSCCYEDMSEFLKGVKIAGVLLRARVRIGCHSFLFERKRLDKSGVYVRFVGSFHLRGKRGYFFAFRRFLRL